MGQPRWLDVGALSAIPVRGSRRLWVGGKPVAIFRTSEDEIFALADRCPHRAGPLSEGIVSGRTVACPLHNWLINLDTGKACAPDEGAVEVFAVKCERGRILIAPPGSFSEAQAREKVPG